MSINQKRCTGFLTLLLGRAGIDSKGHISRTDADKAGQGKNDSDNQQYNAKRSGNVTSVIEHGYYSGGEQADDAVNGLGVLQLCLHRNFLAIV